MELLAQGIENIASPLFGGIPATGSIARTASQGKVVTAYVTLLRIHGPFLVGVSDKLVDKTAGLTGFGDIVVPRLRNMTAIDATGVHTLEAVAARLKASTRTLLLCGADQPARLMEQANFTRHVGRANILPNVDAALALAAEIAADFDAFGADEAFELADAPG